MAMMLHGAKGSRQYEIDMVNGPLLGKMLAFYFPLMFSSVLQLLFNAADVIVVGQYAGSNALAAVGSTSSLINLLTNLFIGLSVGVNVLAAHYYGAKQDAEMKDMVHTAIVTALGAGILLLVLGVALAGPALTAMGTPEDVIDMSILYMRIYFLGMPFSMLYNFGSAVLRAIGDTRRPMSYLFFAGVVNVILNLFFVISLHMGVAGVATATALSQGISAVLVLRCLMMSEGAYKLILTELRADREMIARMMKIGLPAGLQGSLFSISNVLIQSSVNSFGSLVMAGNTAASNIEGFVYVSMNAFQQTAISFTGQNYGAMKYRRILKIAGICLASVTVVGLVLGNAAYFFGTPLLKLYISGDHIEEIVGYGLLRLSFICVPYFLCGIMDTMVGVLRGMGYSVMPMLVSLSGACLFRVIWIYTVFHAHRSLEVLYVSYPISWALTFSVHLICFIVVYRKMIKKASAAPAEA
jgi:putative MATE family efflux protein